MRTDPQVNNWITAQKTRQKSVNDHVSARRAGENVIISLHFWRMSFYSARMDHLVWAGIAALIRELIWERENI